MEMWYVARRRWRLYNINSGGGGDVDGDEDEDDDGDDVFSLSRHTHSTHDCLITSNMKRKSKEKWFESWKSDIFFCFGFSRRRSRNAGEKMTVICKLIVWCVFGVGNNRIAKGTLFGRPTERNRVADVDVKALEVGKKRARTFRLAVNLCQWIDIIFRYVHRTFVHDVSVSEYQSRE